MAPKLPLITPRSLNSALCLALKTTAPFPRPLSSSAVRRLHHTNNKNSSTAMGRSGYDTTNMKTAARPRPAAKGGAGAGDDKKTNTGQSAASQQQHQGECGGKGGDATVSGQTMEQSIDSFLPRIPTGREVEGDPVEHIPLPTLVGRGWTFWL